MDVRLLCCIFLMVTAADCWKAMQYRAICYNIIENVDCLWLSSEEICSSLLQAAVCDAVQSCIETTWSKFTYNGHCEDENYLLELKLMRKDEQYKEIAHDKEDEIYQLKKFSKKCADKYDNEEKFDKCITHYGKLYLAFKYLDTASLDVELACRLHYDPCTPLYDIPYQSDKCDACILVAKQSHLQSSSRKSTETLCSEVATEDVQKCSSFGNKYAPEIEQLQPFGMDPNNICALMDVCPIQTIIKGDECFRCNLAMHLLGLLIERVDSLPDCNELHIVYHSSCQKFTKAFYVDSLVFMKKVEDWDEFCDSLTSCKSTSVISSMKAEKEATDLISTNKCEACLTAVQLMKSDRLFLRAIFEKDCRESSTTLNPVQCEFDNRKSVDRVITGLKIAPPLVVCQYFSLCPVRNN